MKTFFLRCKSAFRLPHPAVRRLLLLGLRLITPFLLYLAIYVTDHPTLTQGEVAQMLQSFLTALWILFGGCAFLNHELQKEDT